MSNELDRRRSPRELLRREELAGEQQHEIELRHLGPSPATRASLALESQKLARDGDCRLLCERLKARNATDDELKLAVDLISGIIKPRKRHHSIRIETRRQLVADFVLETERGDPGRKRDSIVADAMKQFEVCETEVWDCLKKYESK